MPYRISRLGHVEVRSIDLDRDVDYYLNVIGLHQTGREGNTVYLKGWDERHAYSFSLTQAERPGMVRMAFRTVDPEDLDYYEKLSLSRFNYRLIECEGHPNIMEGAAACHLACNAASKEGTRCCNSSTCAYWCSPGTRAGLQASARSPSHHGASLPRRHSGA
jgi:catechol 2,3-dioxygenase-like lactoylglutathione lyase family enzyme